MSQVNRGSNIALSSESQSQWSNLGNSYDSFFQSEEGRKPIEIKNPGRHVLSVTEKGESAVFYNPDFYKKNEAYDLQDYVFSCTNWQTKNITIRGIEYPQPRLVAWYGPFPYSYSGATLKPAKMPGYILEIKEKVEQYLRSHGINVILNSVLLNLYRDNRDSVSWHSDDEMSLGIFPTIASVSFGETRRFEMRRKLKFEEGSSYNKRNEYFINLSHGSLLIMDGSMQEDWQHRIPKENRDICERINLTFRTVYKLESSLPSPDTQIRYPVQKVFKKTCRNKFNYDEKTLHSGTDSACSSIINRSQDLSSCLETVEKTNRSEDKSDAGLSDNDTLKTDEKVNENMKKNSEICSNSTIILKTECNGPEKQDELSHYEKSTLLNNLNGDKKKVKNYEMQSKNIDLGSGCSSISTMHVDGNTGKNMHFCTRDSQSVSTNSAVKNIKESACKLKNESTSSTNNGMKSTSSTDNRTKSTSSTDNGMKYTSSTDNRTKFTSSTDNGMKSNVEVKEFLPANISTKSSENTFGSCRLESLLIYNVDAMGSELLHEYAVALKNKVLEHIHEFIFSEKAELEVLCELTDGNQTDENQKIITTRMYFLIKRALKLLQDIPNIRTSVRNIRQPYRRNRNPYSHRLNQANSRCCHCKR